MLDGRKGSQRRTSIWIPDEDREAVDRLKQLKFYDKSYSELYRHLIKLGLEREKERGI